MHHQCHNDRAQHSAKHCEDHDLLQEAEEELFFCAANAVSLAYVGHYGSSGVLSRAAAAGRWVIASDEGLVGHRVHTHNLGLTFKTGDVAALREALLTALTLTPAKETAFAAGLAVFAKQHSRESFRAALLAQFSTKIQARPLKL